jgi:hypothetical protein
MSQYDMDWERDHPKTPRVKRAEVHPWDERCQRHEAVYMDGECIFLDPDTKEICGKREESCS